VPWFFSAQRLAGAIQPRPTPPVAGQSARAAGRRRRRRRRSRLAAVVSRHARQPVPPNGGVSRRRRRGHCPAVAVAHAPAIRRAPARRVGRLRDADRSLEAPPAPPAPRPSQRGRRSRRWRGRWGRYPGPTPGATLAPQWSARRRPRPCFPARRGRVPLPARAASARRIAPGGQRRRAPASPARQTREHRAAARWRGRDTPSRFRFRAWLSPRQPTGLRSHRPATATRLRGTRRPAQARAALICANPGFRL